MNKQSIGIFFAAALIAVFGGAFFLSLITPVNSVSQLASGTQGANNTFYSVATSGPITVTTSNTLAAATSSGRTWLRISNNSGSSVTCNYQFAATAARGFQIAASSTFEMNQLNEPVFTGAVNCISDTASNATLYVQANQ